MIKAVLFDLGGVVLESPLKIITNFEKTMGLSDGAVTRVILQDGDTGNGNGAEFETGNDADLPFRDAR